MEVNVGAFLSIVESHDWRNRRAHPTKLIASSPFRDRPDETPSFYINLDTTSEYFGCWSDKGAIDPDWASGGPTKLAAYILDITYEEAREKLSSEEVAEEQPRIRIKLTKTQALSRPKPIDITEYLNGEVSYLTGRGISPEIQRMFGVGYDAKRKAAVMPWKSPQGDVLNAKFRATWGKAFWYSTRGAPVKSMIFGIDVIYAQGIKRAAVVEAEIDAMYLWSCGVPAIAVGGAEFTDERADMLKRSPIEELLHGEDNDAAGAKLKRQISEKMRGYCAQYDVEIPREYKDFNEIRDAEKVRSICGQAQLIEDTVRLNIREFPRV